MIASISAFFLTLIWLYPVRIPRIQFGPLNSKPLSELETLLQFRALAQISQTQEFEITASKWKDQIDAALNLSKASGIAILPVIDYIITCERNELALEREFQTRSATAYGASFTLMTMPILMWLVGVAIGVDVFGFFASPIGITLFVVGIGLTAISRLILKLIAKVALKVPNPRIRKPIRSNVASLVVFITAFTFQTTYLGFVCAVLAALFTHAIWEKIPVIDQNRENFEVHHSQHFHIVLIAGLIETGLPWLKVLSFIDEPEIQTISRRIEMGVAPEIAFKHSENWQSVGKLISSSIKMGTRLSNDLRLLAKEYLEMGMAYRIGHIEKIAGRLIIPVNLLQLPAFIFMGLVPMVGPLILQTLQTFHI